MRTYLLTTAFRLSVAAIGAAMFGVAWGFESAAAIADLSLAVPLRGGVSPPLMMLMLSGGAFVTAAVLLPDSSLRPRNCCA